MQIQGTNGIHGPHGVNAPHISTRAAATQSTPASGPLDRLEISPAAQAAMAAEGSPIRQDLVSLIRAQIANGTYDTPDKMDAAMERMLDQIG
jgi:negative regulator of flagellin synthesis FlgM